MWSYLRYQQLKQTNLYIYNFFRIYFTVGNVDMTTYPVAKYYYIIESVYLYIIYHHIVITADCIYSIKNWSRKLLKKEPAIRKYII